MKNKNAIWIIIALIIVFLFATRQGRDVVSRVFQQSGPLIMSFGGDYQPGQYVLPEFTIPLVNGVSLPPPLSSLADKGNCCCSSKPSGAQTRPAIPFVSPSVLPSYTPPPASVAYRAPQEPDWQAYWNMYADVREHYPFAIRQPHFTKGLGKQQADKNRDGVISQLEFAEYHGVYYGEPEGRVIPMKDRY